MNAIEESITVQPDGSILLQHPEFKPGEQVKVIVLLGSPHAAPRVAAAGTGRRLKADWGGGLEHMGGQYTSVELQHKAREWRGD